VTADEVRARINAQFERLGLSLELRHFLGNGHEDAFADGAEERFIVYADPVEPMQCISYGAIREMGSRTELERFARQIGALGMGETIVPKDLDRRPLVRLDPSG
jgi:hypothetical protein